MPYFLMVFSLLLPLSAAFFLPAAFMLSGNKLRKYYASSAMLCSALCLVALAAYACRAARPYELSVSFPPGFDFSLSAGPLPVFLAAMMAAGCCASMFKTCGAADGAGVKAKMRFNASALLFSFFLISAMLSSSLMWICALWLMAAVCLWAISGHSPVQEDNVKSDQLLMRIAAGAMLMFCGAAMAYLQYGSFSLDNLSGESLPLGKALPFIPGLMMPAALLPGLSRLSVAGRRSSDADYLLPAMLYAFAGLCLYARLFCACFAVPESFFAISSAASFVVMAIFSWEAWNETDSKKLSALIASLSLMFAVPGFAASTNMGFSGGLMSLFSAMPVIMALIIIAGIKSKGNLGKTGYAALIICLFSLAGLPPSGTFFSRFMILCGMAQHGSIASFPLFIIFSIAFVFILFRFFRNFSIGQKQNAGGTSEGAALALGIISVLAGLLVYYPSSYIVLSSAIHGVNLQ